MTVIGFANFNRPLSGALMVFTPLSLLVEVGTGSLTAELFWVRCKPGTGPPAKEYVPEESECPYGEIERGTTGRTDCSMFRANVSELREPTSIELLEWKLTGGVS